MKQIVVLLALLLLSGAAFAQDGGAVYLDTFSLENMPMRDLAINCGGGLHLFGDTWKGDVWQPNSGGLTNARGKPEPINNDAALWWPDSDAVVSVPSGCARYGGAVYAFYSDMAANAGHDFTAVSSGVAVSLNNGATWLKVRLFEGDGVLGQAALVAADNALYGLFTDAGRMGALRVGRSTDPARAWEFWNGSAWGGAEGAAVVLDDSVGESSVCWDGGQWQLAYMSPNANAVVVRTAPTLTGPYAEARTLIDWNQYHGIYAPQWVECGRTFLASHNESNLINGLTYPRYAVYLWGL